MRRRAATPFALLLALAPIGAARAQRVAVAARALPRGAVLAAADIDSAAAPSRAHAATPAVVTAGWVTRRVVAAGEPLAPPAVAPPPMVAAGDTVRLVRQAGGIALTLRGVAMAHAPLGARVGVRVPGRGRFEGTVVASAVVRLD